MFLFIDNCSLLRLVHSDSYSQQITKLTNLIRGGHIKLLTHQLILDEWEKHKSSGKSRILKKLMKVHGETSTSQLPSHITIDHIDFQHQTIDELLKSAELVETPTAIRLEFSDRYRKKLAPFHIKIDSQNDWEAFGSIAHYCNVYLINNLYFVSSNDKEFADPNEKTRTLHPDLVARFKPLNVNYFSDMGDFLNSLETLIVPKQLLTMNIVRNERFSHKASVRKHMLDSLYALLKNTYAEVEFVPIHILSRYYPFKAKGSEHNHYSVFTLYYVPDQLVKIFKAISIENSNIKIIDPEVFHGVKDVEEKLRFVLRRLNRNLIYNLTAKNSSNQVNILLDGEKSCSCLNCNFQNLNWKRCITQLQDETADSIEKLKKAFLYYKLGNYDSATEIYISLRDEFKAEEKYILYFICQYNLRHLSFFLSGFMYQSNYTSQEIAGLREIDPIEESVKLKSHTDYDLITYIADGAYFRIAVERIGELVKKIEDHYYSFLNGGWSSNSHVYLLMCEFAELNTFSFNNGLIYDEYGNWERLVYDYIKGLFASHAMRGTDNSSLESFDDYNLSIMIHYGKAEVIAKYFHRFKLKDLAYEKSFNDTSFTALVSNLLNEYTSNTTLIIDGKNPNTKYFPKLEKMINNAVTIASYLEDSAFDPNAFAETLLVYIRSNGGHLEFETALERFLFRKSHLFKQKITLKYLALLVEHLETMGTRSLTILLNRTKKIILGKKQFSKILDNSINRPDYDENFYELLVATFKKSDKAQRELIRIEIANRQSTKFNFSLYYRTLIHGLFPLEENFFYSELKKVDITTKNYDFQSLNTRKPNDYYSRLDELLNIAFKYEVELKSNLARKIKKAGPYYSWLMDMEGFNYSNFKIDWLHHYPTDFYLRQMSKSKNLRQHLIKVLTKNNDSRIEKLLIRMTYFSNII